MHIGRSEGVPQLAKVPRSKRPRPNRIYELTKERNWKYADIAQKISALARDRGAASKTKTHTITITKLATGDIALTQEWMNLLGEVFNVPATDIISPPVAQNLRRVTVVCALQSSHWRAEADLPTQEQYDIMIPNDAALQAVSLYAGEIRGQDNNLRYSQGSVVVVSKLEGRPGEIAEGKRYHVRLMREDGLIEDSIKLMTVGPEGQYWLRPESNHPDFQEWIPLVGKKGVKVEIIGRVRGVFFRED